MAARYEVGTSSIVEQMCDVAGFTNASSFCAAFHRQTGQTPNEYRRQQKYRKRK